MFYLVKSPWLLKKYYGRRIWKVPVHEKLLYLTFDDGPHPIATPFVLDQLKRCNAKAVFFCIGKNVQAYPELYKRILEEGHRVGNHTHNHLNGWKTADGAYFDNIRLAAKYIDSDLFRPPYGRMTGFQASRLMQPGNDFKIIMWDVLSGDFDRDLAPELCADNVIRHADPGSIIVFHDSEKAFDRLSVALPRVLDHFGNQGYRFEAIHFKS